MADEKFDFEQAFRIKVFEEAFSLIDTNNSGYIKPRQLIHFLRNLGMNVNQTHIDQMYISLGIKVDERIDFFDFCLIVETQPSSISSEKLDVTSIYNAFLKPTENVFDRKAFEKTIDYTLGQEVPQSILSELKSSLLSDDDNITLEQFTNKLMIQDRFESIGDLIMRRR